MKTTMLIKSVIPTKQAEVHDWPEVMPELRPTHFKHGDYEGSGVSYVRDKETLANVVVCGTPRCAVGNVLVAFNLDPRVYSWSGSPLEEQANAGKGPVGRFAKRYLKNLRKRTKGEGKPCLSSGLPNGVLQALSDTFEATDDDGNELISNKVAAQEFKRTVKSFGYTQPCKYEQIAVVED